MTRSQVNDQRSVTVRDSSFSTIITDSPTHSKNGSDHTVVALASPEPARHKGYPEYHAKWMNQGRESDTVSPSRTQLERKESKRSSSDRTTSPLSLSHFPPPPRGFESNHASAGSWTSREEYDYVRQQWDNDTIEFSNQGSLISPLSTFIRSQPLRTVYPGHESLGQSPSILTEGSRYPLSSGSPVSYLPSVR